MYMTYLVMQLNKVEIFREFNRMETGGTGSGKKNKSDSNKDEKQRLERETVGRRFGRFHQNILR